MTFRFNIISKLRSLFAGKGKQTEALCENEMVHDDKDAVIVENKIDNNELNDAGVNSETEEPSINNSKQNDIGDKSGIEEPTEIIFIKKKMWRDRDIRRFIKRYRHCGEDRLREYIPLLEDPKLVDTFNKELYRTFYPEKKIDYDTNWKYDESDRPPFLTEEEYKALGGQTNNQKQPNKQSKVRRPIIYHIPMGGSTKWRRR